MERNTFNYYIRLKTQNWVHGLFFFFFSFSLVPNALVCLFFLLQKTKKLLFWMFTVYVCKILSTYTVSPPWNKELFEMGTLPVCVDYLIQFNKRIVTMNIFYEWLASIGIDPRNLASRRQKNTKYFVWVSSAWLIQQLTTEVKEKGEKKTSSMTEIDGLCWKKKKKSSTTTKKITLFTCTSVRMSCPERENAVMPEDVAI